LRIRIFFDQVNHSIKQKSTILKVLFHYKIVVLYLSFESVFIHFVQRVRFTAFPFSVIVVFCKFGLNLRFVARWEKLRLCPKVVVFPQISHFAIFIPFQRLANLIKSK